MPLSALPPKPMLDSLASYPPWLVTACLVVVAAAVVWLLAKVLKWTLYLLVALVIVGGLGAMVWMVVR